MTTSGSTGGGAISERQGEINGLSFHWLEAGPSDAPLALCQHGFPDTPWGWRWLLPELAEAGFHAVAPSARGYAPTAVPDDGGSATSSWVADMIAFHELLGGGQPGVLIGHDWGAFTSYGAASAAPERWRRVVVASVPPAAVMAGRVYQYDQVKRFWYQYVFQQPTAETIVTNNDFEFIEQLWAEWSPGLDATHELPRVKDALRGPANLTAALSTYRSMFDFSLQPPDDLATYGAALLSPWTQPTLYLHGTDDRCVAVDVVPEVEAVLPEGSRAAIVDDAGHFLQYEQPEAVADLITEFVSA